MSVLWQDANHLAELNDLFKRVHALDPSEPTAEFLRKFAALELEFRDLHWRIGLAAQGQAIRVQ